MNTSKGDKYLSLSDVIVCTVAYLELYLFECVIDVEKRQMIAVNVGKTKLGVVGRLLRLVRPNKALRHGEHGRDGEDLVGAVVLARRDQHLGELWIERKFGHDGAKFSQIAVIVQGSQIVEKPLRLKNI